MRTREQIQTEIACTTGTPVELQATAEMTLKVYPPSVGLMMALRAQGNTMAIAIEDPGSIPAVTQEDTLIFYAAITTEPSIARRMLAKGKEAMQEAAEDLSWYLTPSVMSALNAAIAKTREQVEAVSVAIIPDGHSEPSKN